MFREAETKHVKSAKRVMEILEYFTPDNPVATISDIVRDLDYPQSSASELLHCLADLGHLDFNPHDRTFKPTARVGLIGSWVLPTFFQQARIVEIMNGLGAQTGEAIVLATVEGLQVRYIYVCQATNPKRVALKAGAVRPLLHTSIGRLLLSTQSDREVQRIVLRLNAEAKDEWKVSLSELEANLACIRQTGYSLSFDVEEQGGSMVSVLLPHARGGQPLALGIGSASNAIGKHPSRFLSLLQEATMEHASMDTDIAKTNTETFTRPVFARPRLPEADGGSFSWDWRSTS